VFLNTLPYLQPTPRIPEQQEVLTEWDYWYPSFALQGTGRPRPQCCSELERRSNTIIATSPGSFISMRTELIFLALPDAESDWVFSALPSFPVVGLALSGLLFVGHVSPLRIVVGLSNFLRSGGNFH